MLGKTKDEILVGIEFRPVLRGNAQDGHHRNGQHIVIIDRIEIGKIHSPDRKAHVQNICRTDSTVDEHPNVAPQIKGDIVDGPNN